MERRAEPPWTAGCLTLLIGGAAGYGAYRLSSAARHACAVIRREHPSVFDLWTWEAPLTVIVMAFAGLAAWGIPQALTRRVRSDRARLLISGAVFVAVLVVLTLLHFAWLGTPLGVGNDTNGTCGPDNVPSWWPRLLPA
ncbi:hypothetical protein [Streptomyces corynorhini]|nr:hypothetical protein [Streptomyces corynorhini]